MFDQLRRELTALQARATSRPDGPSVRALQTATQDFSRPVEPASPSRAAQLQLIDDLSRRGDAGVAVLVGACVAVAVTSGGIEPWRTALWLGLVFVSAYATGRLRRTFRRGERSAGRPFRWRANYTASLAVLSASAGAGALILHPQASDVPAATDLLFALALAAPVAAWFHRSHRNSAVAAAAPALSFLALAAWRESTETPLVAAVASCLAAIAFAASLAASSSAIRDATRAHPRTRLPRRSKRLVDDTGAEDSDQPDTGTLRRGTK